MKRLFMALAISLVAITSATAGPIKFTFPVPAANMKATALNFLDRFEQDYRRPGLPLPVYSLMYKAAANPDEVAAQRMIATGLDKKPRVIVFKDGGGRLVSDGNAVSNAAFTVLLNGTVGKLLVDFPAHLEAGVTDSKDATGRTKSIGFQFAQPVHMRLQGFPGFPLKDVFLRSISIDQARLSYELGNKPTDPTTLFLVTLEFDPKQGGGR
jgi:hypothetical protein